LAELYDLLPGVIPSVGRLSSHPFLVRFSLLPKRKVGVIGRKGGAGWYRTRT